MRLISKLDEHAFAFKLVGGPLHDDGSLLRNLVVLDHRKPSVARSSLSHTRLATPTKCWSSLSVCLFVRSIVCLSVVDA